MTDNNLTDLEIKKAIECHHDLDCDSCPLKKAGYCTRQLMELVLDLINRIQAENERLKNTLDDALDRQPLLVERSEKYAKAQAYKEFAERLKEKLRCSPQWICHRENYKSYGFSYDDVFSGIDNLLKEMECTSNE